RSCPSFPTRRSSDLETAGTWATGVEASLPANAGSIRGVTLNSVSCASAGNCSAAGTYFDSSSHAQGLLLSETAGTWATGVEASLDRKSTRLNSSHQI